MTERRANEQDGRLVTAGRVSAAREIWKAVFWPLWCIVAEIPLTIIIFRSVQRGRIGRQTVIYCLSLRDWRMLSKRCGTNSKISRRLNSPANVCSQLSPTSAFPLCNCCTVICKCGLQSLAGSALHFLRCTTFLNNKILRSLIVWLTVLV